MDKVIMVLVLFVGLCTVVAAGIGSGVGLVRWWHWYDRRRFYRAGERYRTLVQAYWNNPKYDRRLAPGYRGSYTGPERRGVDAVSVRELFEQVNGPAEEALDMSSLILAYFSRLA